MIEIFKALSDPCRLRLVTILLRGEFTVQELTEIIGTGQSRISHHLKALNEAGLLIVKRQGTWSYYRVCDNNPFFSSLREVIEPQLELLPERSSDLAAVAKALEARRRKSQEFFDLHAMQWDELSRRLLPLPHYQNRLLEAVPSGANILEIGAGTGELLLKLAYVAGKIVGVDHSPAMLDEAKRKVAAQGVDNIELRLGEMNHLPLPDSSVDCVVANMVLHHAADPFSVMTEIRRVLKGCGLLLIADLARHEREAARDQLADQWLGFEENELEGWLINAGFSKLIFDRLVGSAGQESVLIIRAK
ncbi:MAG: metalloregulator ArsR/SmtB family transcription factor [Geobacteraceae bacterium]|nr:metalloregulator ArsR/SmtB family transcription factor [Geobacteraceae bacterium]